MEVSANVSNCFGEIFFGNASEAEEIEKETSSQGGKDEEDDGGDEESVEGDGDQAVDGERQREDQRVVFTFLDALSSFRLDFEFAHLRKDVSGKKRRGGRGSPVGPGLEKQESLSHEDRLENFEVGSRGDEDEKVELESADQIVGELLGRSSRKSRGGHREGLLEGEVGHQNPREESVATSEGEEELVEALQVEELGFVEDDGDEGEDQLVPNHDCQQPKQFLYFRGKGLDRREEEAGEVYWMSSR